MSRGKEVHRQLSNYLKKTEICTDDKNLELFKNINKFIENSKWTLYQTELTLHRGLLTGRIDAMFRSNDIKHANDIYIVDWKCTVNKIIPTKSEEENFNLTTVYDKYRLQLSLYKYIILGNKSFENKNIHLYIGNIFKGKCYFLCCESFSMLFVSRCIKKYFLTGEKNIDNLIKYKEDYLDSL